MAESTILNAASSQLMEDKLTKDERRRIKLSSLLRVPEGFNIGLEPGEALIYLYDGCMVRMSYLGSVQAVGSVYGAENCYSRRQPGYRTILDVDESLFCLGTGVQAFWTNAIDGISHSFTELMQS